MNRPGVALFMALAVLLVVELMTAGMLALTTHARMIAASRMRMARAQAAAQNAARSVVADWQAGTFDTLPRGQLISLAAASGATADLSFETTAERLEGSAYVVRARARAGGERAYATARAVAVGRALDRADVLAAFNRALLSGGQVVMAGATRVGADASALPPAWPDSLCPAVEPLPPPEALAAARPPILAETVSVDGPIRLDSTLVVIDSVALGGIRWSELPGIADRLEGGSLWIGPTVRDSVCDTTAPGNWGDPLDPAASCGAFFPLIVADGDLDLLGGGGQGILVVNGTLTLRPGVVFVGVVLARDGITAEAGSEIVGSLHSASGYALFEDARLTYSRCSIARALLQTSSARRMVLGRRIFIPPF